MQMYCITIKDDHLGKISKLGYLPVGLGKDIFQNHLSEITVKKI